MSATTYVFGIAAAVLVLIVVIELLRRGQLRERHAIWWLVAGMFALLAAVFPATMDWATRLVGIGLPVNLVFFVSIALLFLVCLQHSAELTKLESKTRILAEKIALIEMQLYQQDACEPASEGDDSPRG